MNNLYAMAKNTVENKTQWASGESVILFENSNNKAIVKRDSFGNIQMFITSNKSLKHNAKVVNIDLNIGYPGNFNCTQANYQSWVNRVQRVL